MNKAPLDRYFGVRASGSSLQVEVLAGLTTFMTMAYIVLVNPQILSHAGMPRGAVVTATCISAGLASILMGAWARLPVGLAPGMGTNAYFAYAVVGAMGVPWPTALGAVFLSGVCFLALTIIGLREQILDAIPSSLKHAMAAGIGVFIAFIGLSNAGVVVDHPTVMVQLGDVSSANVAVFSAGLVVTATLVAWRVKGALLIGIALATTLGVILGLAEPPQALVAPPPPLAPTFMAMDLYGALQLGLLDILFAFFFVDLFDTVATLVAVSEHGGLMKDSGEGVRRLPRARAALGTDAIGTMAGAALGTSTVTAYIESSAGVSAGGRTGLTAVVVGLCFLAAPFFYPLIEAVPKEASAPALVLVAALMLKSIAKLDFDDVTEALPAIVTFLAIPLTFSISNGLTLGFILYPLLKVMAGRGREVSTTMYVLAAVFIVKLGWLGT